MVERDTLLQRREAAKESECVTIVTDGIIITDLVGRRFNTVLIIIKIVTSNGTCINMIVLL